MRLDAPRCAQMRLVAARCAQMRLGNLGYLVYLIDLGYLGSPRNRNPPSSGNVYIYIYIAACLRQHGHTYLYINVDISYCLSQYVYPDGPTQL